MFTYSNLVCTQREFKAEQNNPFQEFYIVVLLFTEVGDRKCSRKKYKTVEENRLVKKNNFSITIKIDPTLLLRRILHKLKCSVSLVVVQACNSKTMMAFIVLLFKHSDPFVLTYCTIIDVSFHFSLRMKTCGGV